MLPGRGNPGLNAHARVSRESKIGRFRPAVKETIRPGTTTGTDDTTRGLADRRAARTLRAWACARLTH
jgi:hypothetical protein